ncbi:DUF3011 domain-containing protein [Sandaracinobacter sp. RS1-74]|uniref:DUF3011 domain-containing protein n=1 Tax=Sandaracinobacteroides sayramensis TaxID=2913411 RepID=UPI001EDAAE8C|nr:DUF3011 domain-containing protein [Sandaracinobacteroides sayramensis]MCG2840249.1 DUF3011 domain-containing protein [Sandaracinobacteroides sayramensis]
MPAHSKSLNLGVAAAVAVAQMAPLPLPALAPIALAPIALAFGAAPALAQGGRNTMRINCASGNSGTRTCDLPPNTQSVSFVGPDRSGRCREGSTWGRRGNDLWVSNGCGGTFEVVSYSGGGWNGGGNGGGQGSGFAGEITCRSRDNRQQTCPATTRNRVVMLQQYSSARCIEGSTWRYTQNSIIVRNGCQARFGYGYGNSGGDDWNNGGWNNNSGFAGQTECRSNDNRYRRCSVNTQNRVEMLRQFSSSSCTRGRSWGYDRSGIWVDNGCQARFGYGYGNVSGDTSGGGGGSDTGAVIGGVALAAGLIALLAAAGKSSNSRSASAASGNAKLTADLNKFPSDARTSGEACLKEAARQVGSTGGTAVRLDSIDRAERSGQGWLILARLTGTWPEHSQQMTMDCRATGSSVTAFDVR